MYIHLQTDQGPDIKVVGHTLYNHSVVLSMYTVYSVETLSNSDLMAFRSRDFIAFPVHVTTTTMLFFVEVLSVYRYVD